MCYAVLGLGPGSFLSRDSSDCDLQSLSPTCLVCLSYRNPVRVQLFWTRSKATSIRVTGRTLPLVTDRTIGVCAFLGIIFFLHDHKMLVRMKYVGLPLLVVLILVSPSLMVS